MTTLNHCVPCGTKALSTESACPHCGNRNLHPINFGWVSNSVRNLAVMFALCTITSRDSRHPPYWGELEDDAKGRAELGNRVRALCALTNTGFHGDERAFLIKEWVKRAGLT